MARTASLAAAQAAVDALCAPLGAEAVEPGRAVGRVLAEALAMPSPWPPEARALVDGVAVRAEDTVGASAYSPTYLQALAAGEGCLPGCAVPVRAGDSMPGGADAVLPLYLAQESAGMLEALGTVAPGDGMERPGEDVAAGTALLPAGRRLTALDTALAATLGLATLEVRARPRVRLLTAGRWPAAAQLYVPLVERDGGVLERQACLDEAALAAPGADLVLVVGGASPGTPRRTADMLAATGALEVDGVAIRPGETAGLGRVGAVPVILLPGGPAAGYATYELLAGRAVRRLAGLPLGLPHPKLALPLAGQKLVSEIGSVEIVPVRVVEGGVVPLPVGSGLGSLVRADGFVLVPAEVEGYPPGAVVQVHLLRGSAHG